ncbi:MAG: ribosome-associated translation inhibitor RaiA [Gemmatimonadales bacterium]
MQTTITARHCQITDALRGRAQEVSDRLARHADRPIDGSVIFDIERNEQTVELKIHLAHGEVLIAAGTGADHRTALDRAEERMRRQLERGHVAPNHSKPAGTTEA